MDFLFVSTSYQNYNLAFCMSVLVTVSQGTGEQRQWNYGYGWQIVKTFCLKVGW